MPPSSSLPKPELSKSKKAILWCFVVVQVVIMLVGAYYTYQEWGGLVVLFILTVPQTILSIVGLIFSFSYSKKYKFSRLVIATIIISILGIPPLSFGFDGVLSKLLTPAIRQINSIKYEAANKKYEADAEVLYTRIASEFKQPQKVISVEYGYWVLLGNGYVVDVMDNVPSNQQTAFSLWLKQNLIGKTVTFELAPKQYQDVLTTCKMGSNGGVKEMLDKSGLYRDDGYCFTLMGNIKLDGQDISTFNF